MILFQIFLTLLLSNNTVYHFENIQCNTQFSSLGWSMSSKCDNKDFAMITIPDDADGIIYRVNVGTAPRYRLYNEITSMKEKEPSKLLGLIDHNLGRKRANVYILNSNDNKESFINCSYYSYEEKMINSSSHVGHKECLKGSATSLFVGIEKRARLGRLHYSVEAVAYYQK